MSWPVETLSPTALKAPGCAGASWDADRQLSIGVPENVLPNVNHWREEGGEREERERERREERVRECAHVRSGEGVCGGL